MKQLREHIKKEIKTLMEANYPAPPAIVNALKNRLKLRPLIRYVATLKAVNSLPPSYRVFFHNSQFIDLYVSIEPPFSEIEPPKTTKERFYSKHKLQESDTTLVLLPGSRQQKIDRHWPICWKTVERLREQRPDL